MAEKRFEVVLSDEVIESFGWQESEAPRRIQETVVMELVRLERISQGKATEILGISLWDMPELMARYDIPTIRMSEEELKAELRTEIKRGGQR